MRLCGSTDYFQHRYGQDDAKGTMVRGARGKGLDLARLCYQLADSAYGYVTVPCSCCRSWPIVMYAKYTKQHESAESQSHNIRPQSHPVYDVQ